MSPTFISTIEHLLSFSPRQGANETATALYLQERLKQHTIPFSVQSFSTRLPMVKKQELLADGAPIPCEASSFISGTITGKDHLISSLTSSQDFLHKANINFSPRSKTLSLANYYFAPAVAIAKNDVSKILAASNVQAMVEVEAISHESANILIGNEKDPENILIAHYDSIKSGAIDNASGVSVLLEILENNASLLDTTLFVLSGNEELSYDEPIYWGHGFRELEATHLTQFKNAQRILVIDCVGNGPANIFQDTEIAKLAFPIKNLVELSSSIYLVSGDIDRLMDVYHSDDDTTDQVTEAYLQDTYENVLKYLN